jgi:hypothetical protein
MRPNTRHYVVTVEDCLALGGHFYNRNNFSRTATGIIYQHFSGVATSNTEHSNATFILMKLVHSYHTLYMQQDDWSVKVREGECLLFIFQYYC